MKGAPTEPCTPGSTGSRPALRIGARSAAVLTLVSTAGLTMFMWPLVISPPDEFSHHSDAP